MKNSKQIAETVFRIRDEEQRKINIRNKRIRQISASVSAACIIGAVLFAAHNYKSVNKKFSSQNDDIIMNNTTEKSTISSVDPSTTKSSEQTSESTENITEKDTIQSSHTEEAATVSVSTTQITTQGPTSSNTEPSRTEQPTQATTDEVYIEPKWNEKTLPTQFMEFDLNGIYYNTKNHIIEGYHIGGILGTVTMEGQDVYEDKIHSINAEVFSINGISTNCAVAVKFNGYNSYYVYTNRCYSPATLGELVDALDLNNTISFGTLSLEDDRTYVTDYDRAIIAELLNEYRDCEIRFDSNYHRKLFSVSTNVDMLGISNKSLAVTEDGYIKTNIMEWAYTFYIGEDKAKEIADRLGIDNIERDTTPQDFDPQEEVFYE